MPKEPEAAIVQPDVIPTKVTPQQHTVSPDVGQEEQLYANVQATAAVAEPIPMTTTSAPVVYDEQPQEAVVSEPIYQNQEDLSEYIEDTGLKAIALYDYQAAADDEISFDPDDAITHIEMVCAFKGSREKLKKTKLLFFFVDRRGMVAWFM